MRLRRESLHGLHQASTITANLPSHDQGNSVRVPTREEGGIHLLARHHDQSEEIGAVRWIAVSQFHQRLSIVLSLQLGPAIVEDV